MKVGGIDNPAWSSPNDPRAAAGERRKGEWRSRFVFAVVGLVVIAVLYPATAAVLSRKDYGTFAFWKLPNRIDYCGRRYYDGGTLSGTPAKFQSQDDEKGARWTFLSWTFSGRSIDAVVSPASDRQQTLCTMILYIPLGERRWEDYPLSGGP